MAYLTIHPTHRLAIVCPITHDLPSQMSQPTLLLQHATNHALTLTRLEPQHASNTACHHQRVQTRPLPTTRFLSACMLSPCRHPHAETASTVLWTCKSTSGMAHHPSLSLGVCRRSDLASSVSPSTPSSLSPDHAKGRAIHRKRNPGNELSVLFASGPTPAQGSR